MMEVVKQREKSQQSNLLKLMLSEVFEMDSDGF